MAAWPIPGSQQVAAVPSASSPASGPSLFVPALTLAQSLWSGQDPERKRSLIRQRGEQQERYWGLGPSDHTGQEAATPPLPKLVLEADPTSPPVS